MDDVWSMSVGADTPCMVVNTLRPPAGANVVLPSRFIAHGHQSARHAIYWARSAFLSRWRFEPEQMLPLLHEGGAEYAVVFDPELVSVLNVTRDLVALVDHVVDAWVVEHADEIAAAGWEWLLAFHEVAANEGVERAFVRFREELRPAWANRAGGQTGEVRRQLEVLRGALGFASSRAWWKSASLLLHHSASDTTHAPVPAIEERFASMLRSWDAQ